MLYETHSLHGPGPGPGPKAAAGRAWAGPLPPLWGLGPGPGQQNAKIVLILSEINVERM